jgi:hypothetical protein
MTSLATRDRLTGLALLLAITGIGSLTGLRAGWPRGETLCLIVAVWILVGVWARPALFWESRKIAWARGAFGDLGAALLYSACAVGLIWAGVVFREQLRF